MSLLPLPHMFNPLSCLPVVADHVAGTGTWRVVMQMRPSHSCTQIWRGSQEETNQSVLAASIMVVRCILQVRLWLSCRGLVQLSMSVSRTPCVCANTGRLCASHHCGCMPSAHLLM